MELVREAMPEEYERCCVLCRIAMSHCLQCIVQVFIFALHAFMSHTARQKKNFTQQKLEGMFYLFSEYHKNNRFVLSSLT